MYIALMEHKGLFINVLWCCCDLAVVGKEMSSVAHTGSGGRVQIVMVEELQKGMGHHWGDRKCVCV